MLTGRWHTDTGEADFSVSDAVVSFACHSTNRMPRGPLRILQGISDDVTCWRFSVPSRQSLLPVGETKVFQATWSQVS